VPDPIPDTDQAPPTPAELAMADTALQLALDTDLANYRDGTVRLTWAGLHALPALAAMLDELATELVVPGYGRALLDLPDSASLAFAIIQLLDNQPELARTLLAEGTR
jgi:hypothetical protein